MNTLKNFFLPFFDPNQAQIPFKRGTFSLYWSEISPRPFQEISKMCVTKCTRK